MRPVPFRNPGGYSLRRLPTLHSMAKLESNIQARDHGFHASGNGCPAKLVVLDMEGVFELPSKLLDVEVDIVHALID